jgi:signal transduction histidine kinase
MRLADGVAEFRVSDDGPGIDPRFHDRIFLIFQTLASRDDVEASGIGLAIVKKKVQRHGGQIRVESAPPARGTSFVFTWREEA